MQKQVLIRIEEESLQKYKELLDRPGVLGKLQSIGGRKNSGQNTLFNMLFERAYPIMVNEFKDVMNGE